jgi:hypothetical protein
MTDRRAIALTLSASVLTVAGIAVPSIPARADVTVQQQVNLDIASIKMDTTMTERIAGDKRRNDSETHCHGLLSFVCRDVQYGEIVRLDKQLEWRLEPKQKSYVETLFPTPEQRAEARQKMQAMMDQMKQCAQQHQAQASNSPDTTHCELSKPTVSVKQSDEHLTLLGHDTRKSSVVLSQSCADKQTGDICEMNYTFDSWLTQDNIPGAAERKEFLQKYLAAQGLDPNDPQLQGAMRQLLAQYGDQLKELSGQASALKGFPLRTTFSLSVGGEHCGKAKQAATQSAANGTPKDLGLKSLASTAVGSTLSSLFSRHGASSAVGAAASQVGENATAAATDAATKPAGDSGKPADAPSAAAASTVQVASFTIETKSIDTASIPTDQFEIPAGWKLQAPKASAKEKEFSCPAPGAS